MGDPAYNWEVILDDRGKKETHIYKNRTKTEVEAIIKAECGDVYLDKSATMRIIQPEEIPKEEEE